MFLGPGQTSVRPCVGKAADCTLSPVGVPTSVQALDPDKLPDGEALLEWLLAPVPADTFMDHIFDDRPLLVSRPDSPRYYAPWFSRATVDDLLRHAAGSRQSFASSSADGFSHCSTLSPHGKLAVNPTQQGSEPSSNVRTPASHILARRPLCLRHR